MRKQTITIILVLAACQLAWGTVTNIYEDTLIESGTYDTVNIYDSETIPSVQTAVTMTGGLIYSCYVYDTATLNFNNGDIGTLYMNDFSVANMRSNNTPTTMYLYDYSQIHLYNGTAGMFNTLIYDSAELHIYGYNLYYDETPSPNWVTGQWKDGQNFTIFLRNITSYSPNQVILHEIPEPTTFFLFSIGGILLKRRYS